MKGNEFKSNLAQLRSWSHDLETDDDWQGPRGLLAWAIGELEGIAQERREVSKMLEHAALVMHEAAPGRAHVDHARAVLNKRGPR